MLKYCAAFSCTTWRLSIVKYFVSNVNGAMQVKINLGNFIVEVEEASNELLDEHI